MTSVWRQSVADAGVPFDEIIAAARHRIDVDGAAFTHVGFSFTSQITVDDNWDNMLKVSLADGASTPQPKLPIFIEMERGPAGLDGVLHYRADLYDHHHMSRVLTRFESTFRRLLTASFSKAST